MKTNTALHLFAFVTPLVLASFAQAQTAAHVNADPRMTLAVAPPDAAPATASKVAAPAEQVVAGTIYDANTREPRPVRLRADYSIRSEPAAGAPKVAMIRDAVAEADLVISGPKIIETADGKKETWIQIRYHGQPAWIHGDALLDKDAVALPPEQLPTDASAPASTAAAPTTAASSPPAPAPAVAHAPPAPSSALSLQPQPPAAPKPPAAPVAAPAPPKKDGPVCIGTRAEMKANPRFQKVFGDREPFSRWTWSNMIASATLDVFPDGHAVLDHPMKGKMRVSISLCLDKNNVPYGKYNGSAIYFDGPALRTAQITHEGTVYTFSRTAN